MMVMMMTPMVICTDFCLDCDDSFCKTLRILWPVIRVFFAPTSAPPPHNDDGSGDGDAMFG